MAEDLDFRSALRQRSIKADSRGGESFCPLAQSLFHPPPPSLQVSGLRSPPSSPSHRVHKDAFDMGEKHQANAQHDQHHGKADAKLRRVHRSRAEEPQTETFYNGRQRI